MSPLILISVVVSWMCVGHASELTCAEEGCSNITIYLGPKWGMKVIRYPNNPKNRGPSEEKVRSVTPESWQGTVKPLTIKSIGHQRPVTHKPTQPFIHRRPVDKERLISVDLMEKEEESLNRHWVGRTTPDWRNRPKTQESVSDTFEEGTINMTGMDISGDDVKMSLSSISEWMDKDVIQQTRRLYLSRNQIKSLPVLTFPVALEYKLQELFLDDNPLFYLNGDTRFELSRLGRLRVLSLAHARLSVLELPSLPILERLDLQGNELVSLPQSLGMLSSLRELDLSGNHLYYLYNSPLSRLVSLRLLALDGNKLDDIGDNVFTPLTNLETLKLNNNSLISFSKMNLHYGTKLHLSDNPWQCSCPLLSAANRYWPFIQDRHILKCNDTDAGKLRLLISLTPQELRLGCPVNVTPWSWVKARAKHLEYVPRWFSRHGMEIFTFVSVLGWVLFAGALIIIVHAKWQARAKKAPVPDLPYKILDDKLIF